LSAETETPVVAESPPIAPVLPIEPEKPAVRPQILLKADSVTLVVKAEAGGKIRLTCSAWEDARIVLPDQTLELRSVGGKGHIVRTTK